jgi:ethanolamine ammonia-lyase small subunit
VSLPVKDWLSFRLDHAKARDAVYSPFRPDEIALRLKDLGFESFQLESRARDKKEYLARPDLGRRLSEDSAGKLEKIAKELEGGPPDILVAICDGLSARAVHENSAEVASEFLKAAKDSGYSAAPIALVTRGRVAVADEIAGCFQAKVVVNLIGERPGLSSPNSMGAYITYGAYAGIMEECRNCISNIRPRGLSAKSAVKKLSYLVQRALALKITGTELKDDMPESYLPFAGGTLLVD